jgi:biopolymer transport protein ExbD
MASGDQKAVSLFWTMREDVNLDGAAAEIYAMAVEDWRLGAEPPGSVPTETTGVARARGCVAHNRPTTRINWLGVLAVKISSGRRAVERQAAWCRMKGRLRAVTLTTARVPSLSGGIAAALASVVLVVLFSMYLVPFGAIVCGAGVPVNTPAITAGEEYFDKPDTIILTVRADRSVYLGPNAIRPAELEAHLRALRLKYPERGLELRAAGTSTLGELAPILGAMRRAGYPRFWVFGNRSSILELTSRVAGT